MPEPQTPGEALVLHPDDRAARRSGVVIAAVAATAAVTAGVELAARGSLALGLAAAVVAIAAAALAGVVLYGSSHLVVSVDAAWVVVGTQTLPRRAVAGLRRHGPRAPGIDIVDPAGEVLYAMPAWFSTEQERAFAAAVGHAIEEAPSPPAEAAAVAPPEDA